MMITGRDSNEKKILIINGIQTIAALLNRYVTELYQTSSNYRFWLTKSGTDKFVESGDTAKFEMYPGAIISLFVKPAVFFKSQTLTKLRSFIFLMKIRKKRHLFGRKLTL